MFGRSRFLKALAADACYWPQCEGLLALWRSRHCEDGQGGHDFAGQPLPDHDYAHRQCVEVQFAQPHQAMAAQHDLDKKQLQGSEKLHALSCKVFNYKKPGMSGAFLTVEFAYPQGAKMRAHSEHQTSHPSSRMQDTHRFLPHRIRACYSIWQLRAWAAQVHSVAACCLKS